MIRILRWLNRQMWRIFTRDYYVAPWEREAPRPPSAKIADMKLKHDAYVQERIAAERMKFQNEFINSEACQRWVQERVDQAVLAEHDETCQDCGMENGVLAECPRRTGLRLAANRLKVEEGK